MTQPDCLEILRLGEDVLYWAQKWTYTDGEGAVIKIETLNSQQLAVVIWITAAVVAALVFVPTNSDAGWNLRILAIPATFGFGYLGRLFFMKTEYPTRLQVGVWCGALLLALCFLLRALVRAAYF